MTLCPFDGIHGTVWVNPAHVVAVSPNPFPEMFPDVPEPPLTVIYTDNSAAFFYVMPNPGRTAERLIEWSRGGDI